MRLFLLVLSIFLAMPYCHAFGKPNQADTPDSMPAETVSKYTFNDDDILSGKVVKLKKGTTLPITLQTPIDTSNAQLNDEIAATLDEDLEYEGTVIAEKGSVVYGKIVKARNGNKGLRNGKVKIDFDKLVTTKNRTIDITTKSTDFVITQGETWVNALKIVGIVTLAAGYIFITFGGGVVVVALLGMRYCLDHSGKDAIIPASTPIDIELRKSQKVIAGI